VVVTSPNDKNYIAKRKNITDYYHKGITNTELLGIFWRIWKLWLLNFWNEQIIGNSVRIGFRVDCQGTLERLKKNHPTEIKPRYFLRIHKDWKENWVIISGKQILDEDPRDSLQTEERKLRLHSYERYMLSTKESAHLLAGCNISLNWYLCFF
jgi:hypothetical protein